MIQAIQGRNRWLGYFLRGATRFARRRTVDAIARFVTGILCAAYDRSVAAIQQAVADAATPSAMRQFLHRKELTPRLACLVDWKTGQCIRKALRAPKNRRGSIIFAIDSTCKSTLSQRARHVFRIGRWKQSAAANHIFVCGLLLFPDGRRLPVRPRQKKRGRRAATQIDLAVALVRQLTPWLRGRSVVVVADGFFFSNKLVRALQASPFHYVVACQDNTILTDGTHVRELRARTRLHRSCATLPGSRGERSQTFSAALRHVCLRCGGYQALVFSRRYRKRGAKVKYLVSDLVDAPVEQIVRLYALRWQVEVYFRDAKMFLGFDQYRVTGPHAPENFVLLVTLAYQFLHWRAGAAARRAGTLVRLRDFMDEVTLDNVQALERAVLTRHRRRAIREHFGFTHRPKAHDSCPPHKASSKLRAVS